MTHARQIGQAILPGIVLVVAILVTMSLVAGPARDMAGKERAEAVYAVTAQDVTIATNRATLRAFGEVVAAEEAELRIASPGEVVALSDNLAVGRRVTAGEALVTIDAFAYRGAVTEAEAQLAEARARAAEAASHIAMQESMLKRLDEQFVFATRDLGRAEQLASSGTITDKALDDRRLLVSQRQQALDQGRFALEVERARRDQQQATIERLEWQVEKAERALADTVLEAPFDGIVRAENVAIGRLMAANDVAVSLIGADALDLRFVLSDQLYGRLRFNDALFGAPVEAIWRVGDIPLTYRGTVTRAGADIQSARGGVDVFARLALDGAAPPRPGAFVEVRLPGIAHPDSVRLPASALYGQSVFVIGTDERLAHIPVDVLAIDEGDVIVAGALREGDAVVTTHLAEAGAGIKVRRVTPSAGPGAPTPVPDVAGVPPAETDAPEGPAGGEPPRRERS
ncbi:MAG: efflux RND transporter periplasmic adaptor subunit [Acuticoccus sp.]